MAKPINLSRAINSLGSLLVLLKLLDGAARDLLLGREVPHLQAEQLFLAEHAAHVPIESVHHNGLDISILKSKLDDEAANLHLVELFSQLLVFHAINFVVLLHKQLLELVFVRAFDDPFGHGGHTPGRAVLAHSKDALNALTSAAGHITLEGGHSEADHVQLLFLVALQERREPFVDVEEADHCLLILHHQLVTGYAQSVISLDVLEVGVGRVAAIELKISLALVILDHLIHRVSFEIFCRKDRWRDVGNLFNDCDKESRSILVVRHDSDAFFQLIQNILRIVRHKHGLFDVGMRGCRHLAEILVLCEVGVANLFFVGGLIEKLPLCEACLEAEARNLHLVKFNLILEFCQDCCDYTFIFDWV